MTVEVIFKELAEHMLDGVMVHEEMSTYYRFLSLKGYSRMHDWHTAKEYCGYKKLCRYFMGHYGKLVPKHAPKAQSIVPDTWYSYKSADVDVNTKREAVRTGLEKWAAWETETKEFYQNMYKELCEIGEIAAAKFLCKYIKEVDKELEKAEYYIICKKSVDYSIVSILEEQKPKHKHYKEKMCCVKEMLCK